MTCTWVDGSSMQRQDVLELEMERDWVQRIMNQWKRKETESDFLSTEIIKDPHVCTGDEMEAPKGVVVQHQHARAEDTHEVELNQEIPGMDNAVAEDTPVHEVLLNSSRKMEPHVVKIHLEISGLNPTVAEDTPVCEV